MVGKRIKAYLDANGIKKSFLSEKASISNSKLTAIFNGSRKLEVMEYFRICTALNVDMMTFIAEGESEL